MNEYIETKSNCRCCGSENLFLGVELMPVPIISPNVDVTTDISDSQLTEITCPLEIYVCEDCGLNQLIHVVDPCLIYKNYLYETNISLGLDLHFKSLQEQICERLKLVEHAKVVEFGSNDGTLLSHFKNAGMSVQGVDPASKASETARRAGIPTVTDFFHKELAERIRADFGSADVIISNNTMANIDDLADIFAGVECLLSDDGAFVFETQYALDVIENNLLDVIYHEHITYFSVKPLFTSLKKHGLELFHADRIPTKGGSIRFWLQKAGGPRDIAPVVHELLALEEKQGLYRPEKHLAFSNHIKAINDRIQSHIADAHVNGGLVAAYGTSVGSLALVHQFELQDKIHCFFDDKPTKAVIEGPGYQLPVLGPQSVVELDPRLIIVLAWRYADVIAEKHPKYFETGGKFFVPLPNGRFIEAPDL